MRVPIRFKIFSLTMMFLLILTGLFFKLSYSFFVEDKVNTVQEIQSLQVNKASNEIVANISNAINVLRESSLRVVDSSRGIVRAENTGLLWLRADQKVWNSSDSDKLNFASIIPSTTEELTLRIVSVSGTEYFLIEDTVLTKKGKKNFTTHYQGVFSLQSIVGAPSLQQGFTKAVVLSLERYKKTKSPVKAIVSGSDEVKALISSIVSPQKEIWLKKFDNSKQAMGTIQKDSEGNPLALVGWSPVYFNQKNSGLFIVSLLDFSKIEEGFKDFLIQLGVAVFLIVGLSVFAAGFLARHISLPIERVVKATAQLETGNFDVKVDVNQSDEVGDLGRAFNHLGSALKEREEQLSEAHGALVQNEKLAALGTLSAGIAHEVKNPLAGILGNVELAESALETLPEQNKIKISKYIDVIKKETKRTRGIIDGLMRFSRKEKAEHESFDLEVVLHETIALVEHSLNMNSVVLKTDFDADLKQVSGHANSIEQVFLNMVQNAGHAMPEGGEIKLTTKYYPSEECEVGSFIALQSPEFKGPFCRVEIKDTGSGMTREIMEKIFEPFFTTKGAGVGTGLGLSVTMNILNEHKSRVSIDSEPGVGTTFYLDFMASGERSDQSQEKIDEVMSRKKGGEGDYKPSHSEVSDDVRPDLPPPPSMLSDRGVSDDIAKSEFGDDEDQNDSSEDSSLGSIRDLQAKRKRPVSGVDLGTVTNFAIRKPGAKK